MPCLQLKITSHTLRIGRCHPEPSCWPHIRPPRQLILQAIPRREVHASLAALLGQRALPMGMQLFQDTPACLVDGHCWQLVSAAASADAPAAEFRNTPGNTPGVGETSYRGPAPILNLVPVRCSKVGSAIHAWVPVCVSLTANY